MNYLLEKKHILELKLKLTSIKLDKQDCIRNQQYEKVADLRQEEKQLMEALGEIQNNLLELQANFDKTKQSAEDYNYISILIDEISLQQLPNNPKDYDSEAKKPNNIEAFEQIIQIKNNLLKEHGLQRD
ncbi:MAG: hypothetical protein ACKO7P_04840 [Bacteroidota bacterium]